MPGCGFQERYQVSHYPQHKSLTGLRLSGNGGDQSASNGNRAVRRYVLRYAPFAMQRFLIVIGLLCLLAGLAWPWLSKLPLGRLPGDIRIVREGFSFYFPIVTSIVISVLVSLLLWIFRR